MKNIKFIFTACIAFIMIGCETEERDLGFVDNADAPTNTAVAFSVTQDNTGLVTLTPNADGAVRFDLDFGDGTGSSGVLDVGESVDHIYAEGEYTVNLKSIAINGKETLSSHQLVVSFQPPQNVLVDIQNDGVVSNTVRINVSADFATMYEVDFGNGNNDILSSNIDQELVFEYSQAGIYTITVTVMSAAIETFVYTEEFEVTEILAPIVAAPVPPFRQDADVISIYSDAYTNIVTTEFPTEWSDTEFAEIQVEGDNVVNYTNLAFTGIVTDYANPTDLTAMEFVHFDYWTADGTTLGFKIVNTALDPAQEDIENVVEVVQDQWVSVDIPLSDFDMDRSQVTQLLFDALGNRATFFIDNLYFWKVPSAGSPPLLSDDFEGNGNIATWNGDAAGANASFANPYNNADNFSETVLEYKDEGGQFANVQFVGPGKFDLTNGQSFFSLKVYVPSSSITGGQPNQISLKLQNSDLGGNSWQTQTEVIKPIVLDQWQTITFDFVNDDWVNLNFNGIDPDPVDRTDLDKVVIQLNSENNNDFVTGYIDDFYYGLAPLEEAPPFVKDGFEGQGTITDWLGDAIGIDTVFPNPFVDSGNTSPTVMEYTDTGGQFANAQFIVPEKFTIADKSTFSIKIYVPSSSISGSQANQVSLKLQNSELGGNSWQTQTEVMKPIVLDQWQIITFDFIEDNWINLNFNGPDPAPIERTDLDKVVIQVNSENNNDTVTAYIDNVDYY